jgi:NAD(P)-dependent dehydrogenase (short-subunit alcohol dehydrogenase family)
MWWVMSVVKALAAGPGRSRRWGAAQIGDLSGRTALVTGSSAGLGLEIARVLAGHGALVVLACRNLGKAERAAEQIRAGEPRARLEVVELDLARQASVRAAAGQISHRYPRLDLLINNAGVMEPPYQRTEDGFELTMATNHLGHFALTGLVLDRLLATPGSRVVTMSSQGHWDGVMNFDDLQSERDYRPDTAYYQSKLANLLFTYELDRRLRAAGAATSALGAHPGVVRTDLFRTRSRLNQALISPRLRAVNFWFAQSVQMGALPALRAAADPAARGGEFYGPRRRFDTGYPERVASSERSRDVAGQARLWEVSERLTGVRYGLDTRGALA